MDPVSPSPHPPGSAPRPRPTDRLTVHITDVAFGGEGVARHNDFVILTPFTAPGEIVEVEVIDVKPRFARARLLEVKQPSEDRVGPECRYFGACGGCQYQHLAYPAQLALKHRQIRDVLQRLGHFDSIQLDPVIPSPRSYHYRNRIMVRSQWSKPDQRLVIGYLRHDNRLVVDVEECRIADPALNHQLVELRRHPPPKGGLKVVLRLPPEDWVLPKDSFFQNNFHLLPALVDALRQRLIDGSCRFLVDAYCGVGFLGLELADLVESYTGIELDPAAIRAARLNARQRGRANGQFLAGTVEEHLPEVLERFDPASTALILDPPRRGCARSTLEVLRRARPAQILHVSCNPATLARDLRILCQDGHYRLDRVTPLDLFPQTQHVELIADLRSGQLHTGQLQPCQGTPL